MKRPLNVLWVIDHVCYDGSLHGGGRLFMNLMPKFDNDRTRIYPYFLRASAEVRQLFADANHPVVTLDKGKYDATALWTMDELCRRHDIDVIHSFCYAASTFCRIVGRWRGIPTLIHDFDTQVYFPYPLYLRTLDRLLAKSTARGLAASSFCRDYMRDVRGVPADRIDVMYHVIPESLLQQADSMSGAAERQALGWPAEAFVFAAITKLGPDRGNEVLLDAFRKVVDRLPHARLALVYKPTLYHRIPKEYEHIEWIRDPVAMRERLVVQIAQLGLQDKVLLVEMNDQVAPYYAASDLLVAPFENDRFSSVNLVEGLAFGRPFIATSLGEPKEILDEHGVGIQVRPSDVVALSDAMIRAATDPRLLADLSARARAAARHFTVEAAADRMASLYERLARRAGAVSGKMQEVTGASR